MSIRTINNSIGGGKLRKRGIVYFVHLTRRIRRRQKLIGKRDPKESDACICGNISNR